MDIIINLLSIILFSILLVKSVDWMISSSSRLSRHFRISEYTISFLVIAFATSLPELMVGIVSTIDKKPALSYGNVLGSNIADLTIILAIPIFVGGAISTREIIKNRDDVFTLFFGLLPIALLLDGTLSRTDGIILILSYVFYLLQVLKRSSFLENIKDSLIYTNIVRDMAIFILSIVTLLISADILVKVAENLSTLAGIPLIFIGLTVTALGTSLPELAFGLKAVKSRHKGEVLGNIVGSVVANSTLVLGITSVISPIEKVENIGKSSTGFLLLILILFFAFSLKQKIGKLEGTILILLYMAFILVEQYFAF